MSVEVKRLYEKEQRRKALDFEYSKLIDNAVGKVKEKYSKKKQARWNKIEKAFDRKTSKLVLLEKQKGKLGSLSKEKDIIKQKEKIEKTKNKDVSIKKNYKQLAFKYFQLYIRLLYANKDGMVWLYWEGKLVHYKKCVAWHMFPKQKYPHMVFLEDNCIPISWMTNRQQLDTVWEFWMPALIRVIWEERVLKLRQIAGDTIAKNQLRKIEYYRWQYELWKGRCEVIAKEKWFTI